MFAAILSALLKALSGGLLDWFKAKQAREDTQKRALAEKANEELKKDLKEVQDEKKRDRIINDLDHDTIDARMRDTLDKLRSGSGE